ncbi:hypothetical protein SAMN04487787_12525 [Kosakonia sacchari]|nr:hypothetical protein SAMN04487787_12525 [Kosakonia sacchari]
MNLSALPHYFCCVYMQINDSLSSCWVSGINGKRRFFYIGFDGGRTGKCVVWFTAPLIGIFILGISRTNPPPINIQQKSGPACSSKYLTLNMLKTL